MTFVKIVNTSNPRNFSITAYLCDSFIKKLKGYMFSSPIDQFQGLLFIEKSPSQINTAIHTLFMNFDITTIWLNSSRKIIDLKIAKKWRLCYFPKEPAKYVIETHAIHFYEFNNGDQIEILDSNK